MLIYFAGANNHMWAAALAGKRVLETFSDIRPAVERYRPTWEGAMLDSGAFTAKTQGVVIDIYEYRDFAVQHGNFYDVIVNLDDIGGNIDRSVKNLEILSEGINGVMPVFHQGEPWSVLCDMAADFAYIGVGLQRPIQNAREWLDGVFDRVGETRVHGFALTSYIDRYPFFSVDSTTWIHEVHGLMSVRGQGADALKLLTPAEIITIIQKNTSGPPRPQPGTGQHKHSNLKWIFDEDFQRV